jgi:hypothetical protein
MSRALTSAGRRASSATLALAMLLGACPGLAAPVNPGRLFFTPQQRAQLEAARARDARPGSGKLIAPGDASVLLRYDGVVIRSDGKSTRWIDGKTQRDGAAVQGLKPGQIRADGKVYEPYQVLRPSPNPAESGAKESAP